MTEATGQVPNDTSDTLSFDGDYDAERAKALIERLREENKGLKGTQQPQDEKDAKVIAGLRRQLEEMKPRADQFAALEEASKSEQQRKDEAVATAQREAEQARAETIRYKAAAIHGISADHFDLLGTGTEEEVSARAEKIAALLAVAAQPAAPGSPPTRPVEQLRPGATPADQPDADELVYQQLFGAPK